MPTVLITGANRGIGLEFVRQYAVDGWHVLACCRTPEAADDLNRLAADHPGIAVVPLDVADRDAIRRLAAERVGEAIDVLIANAGIRSSARNENRGPTQTLGRIDYEEWAELFEVNTLGAVALAEAFAPHVARSAEKKIVAVTSRMGSIADNSSGGSYAYRSSKAALNAAIKSMAIDLSGQGVSAIVVHPGWVQTAMGGPGALITAQESVAGMRAIIARLSHGNSGKFYHTDGSEIPW